MAREQKNKKIVGEEVIPVNNEGQSMVGCIYCHMFGLCVIERKLSELATLVRLHAIKDIDLYRVVGGNCKKFARETDAF